MCSIRRLAQALALTYAFLAATVALGGSLTPPNGPVAPTGKTLREVEPRILLNSTNTPGDAQSMLKITSPGSYYLGENLLVAPSMSGIKVEADDVTIDLNGYRIGGFAGALSGVIMSGARSNLMIRNGFIRYFADYGIHLSPASQFSSGCRVEDVHVSDCGKSGIQMFFHGAVLERVIARNNGATGINAGKNSVLVSCKAMDNAGTGIRTDSGSTVTGCTASDNGASGFDSSFTRFVNCTASSNDQGGFTCTNGSALNGCVSHFNSGGPGIRVITGCLVESCVVHDNVAHGIRAEVDCVVRNNLCTENSSVDPLMSNIFANVRCRIEGNTCISSRTGIRVDGTHSIIVGNTCSNNSVNWVIAANNFYGPIIDRSSASTLAVSGNAAASTLGATDPNANFTH